MNSDTQDLDIAIVEGSANESFKISGLHGSCILRIPSAGSDEIGNWKMLDYLDFANSALRELAEINQRGVQRNELAKKLKKLSEFAAFSICNGVQLDDGRCASLAGQVYVEAIEWSNLKTGRKMRQSGQRQARVNRSRKWTPNRKVLIESLRAAWVKYPRQKTKAIKSAALSFGRCERTMQTRIREHSISDDEWQINQSEDFAE